MLRANVTVAGDVVRIGDVIDNAGTAAQIAIYRAPDLGTTGSLPTAQVLSALRAHQVIGVDTRDMREISVTRLARTLEAKDIELQVARALEHRNGLGDAANLSADLRSRHAGSAGSTPPTPARCSRPSARYEPRNGRFDVTFEIANERQCRADAAALHRHRDRNRRGRGAGAQRRAQRSPEILRRGGRAAAQGRSRQRRRSARPRGRHAGAPAASRRAGAEDRRPRQARSGAARPERHLDLRSHRRFTSPSAARRSTAAPKATSSTCSICNPSAPCPAS